MAIGSLTPENPALSGLTPRTSTAGPLSEGVERQQQAAQLRSPTDRLARTETRQEPPAGADDVRDFVRLATGNEVAGDAPRSIGQPAVEVGRDQSLPSPVDSNRAQVLDIAV